jgi:hypothetical protein
MDAFDADALIYAAVPAHPLGQRIAALFRSVGPGTMAGTGSVLLLPEILSKPLRDGATDEVRILAGLLARLDLRPVERAARGTRDRPIQQVPAETRRRHASGHRRGSWRRPFITNNRRGFPATITEIKVTYPADLTDATP